MSDESISYREAMSIANARICAYRDAWPWVGRGFSEWVYRCPRSGGTVRFQIVYRMGVLYVYVRDSVRYAAEDYMPYKQWNFPATAEGVKKAAEKFKELKKIYERIEE